jgi:hypothetical protein
MLASTYIPCLLPCRAYLLDLEPFLVTLCSSGLAGLGLGRGRICHVDVGHGCVMYRGGGVRGDLVGVEAAAGVDAARL